MANIEDTETGFAHKIEEPGKREKKMRNNNEIKSILIRNHLPFRDSFHTQWLGYHYFIS